MVLEGTVCVHIEGKGVGIEASSTACLSSLENVAVVVLHAHVCRDSRVCVRAAEVSGLSVVGWLSRAYAKCEG
jgi:hypothetical protein